MGIPCQDFIFSVSPWAAGRNVLCHTKRAPRRTRTHRAALASDDAPPRGAPMSASTPPPGGGPEPAPPAPLLSAGGDDDDHDHDFSPLLDLQQRFPDLFLKKVLERLDPTARASLARTGNAFWDLVYPRSIFPLGLLRAETPAAGAARVFKLLSFLGSIERLAWQGLTLVHVSAQPEPFLPLTD